MVDQDKASTANHRIQLPDSPLTELESELAENEELVLHNFARFIQYEKDASVLHALDAILATNALVHSEGQDNPHLLVRVPLWALNAISGRYASYSDAHIEDRSTKFGEAFGVEGGGQGKPPKIRSHLKEARNRSLCMTVAYEKRRNPDKSLDKIFSELASEEQKNEEDTASGISAEHLKDIWKKHRKTANEALDRALEHFMGQLKIGS